MSDHSGNSQGDEEPMRKRFKAEGSSTFEKACQTEGPWGWDTIIVNRIPTNVDYEKLISVFSHYGNIENTYLCKKPEWKYKKGERVARITFSNEDDALKVWKASQEKLIKYDNHVLTVTLASTDYSPIQNLPDTCLREIFQRVNSLEDKLNVELVCRRWRDHGRCCWSSIKRITPAGENFEIKTWKVIFSRVANSLEFLNFCDCENPEETFEVAAEHCVRLKKLKCCFIEMDDDLSNLHMQTLLRKNESLRWFELETYIRVDMHFIQALPSELYGLDIRSLDENRAIPANVALSRFQNLRVLILHEVTVTHHQSFDSIVHLEQLGLMNCNIPQTSVSTILKNNKGLKYLDIATGPLTEASLMYVQQLPKLQILVLESTTFTDTHLQGMRSLKALSLSRCSRITDEGIRTYLNRVLDITHLCLFECSTTLRSMVIAREWTERTGKSLKLFVDEELFVEYSIIEKKATQNFKVGKVYDGGVRETTDDDWFRELIE